MSMITSEDVATAFDEVAPRYDLMVALNPGYHAHLRSAAMRLVEWLPRPKIASSMRPEPVEGRRHTFVFLILVADRAHPPVPCCGLRRRLASRSSILGVDASLAMLEQARAKQWPAGVRFEMGQAEKIAWSRYEWELDDPIDGAFAAYLFRNVGDRDAVLAGIFDLLADGGVLVVQEYSIAGSRPWVHAVWSAVCWLVVIPLGWLTSRRTRLYRYLWRSVRSFDSIQTFVDRLYRAGFVDVEVRTVPGWQRGILHTFRARKPSAAS